MDKKLTLVGEEQCSRIGALSKAELDNANLGIHCMKQGLSFREMCVRVCVCVCVCLRERERDRQTDKKTDRQKGIYQMPCSASCRIINANLWFFLAFCSFSSKRNKCVSCSLFAVNKALFPVSRDGRSASELQLCI